jgi:hypothetical protein
MIPIRKGPSGKPLVSREIRPLSRSLLLPSAAVAAVVVSAAVVVASEFLGLIWLKEILDIVKIIYYTEKSEEAAK